MSEAKKQEMPVVIQTPPPQYSQTVGGSGRKSTVVLVAYASAVTALLFAALVVGGVMYNSGANCKTDSGAKSESSNVETHTKEYEDDNKQTVRQEVDLDYDKEVEVIRFANTGASTDGAVVVIDYKRSMTGMYMPDTDECYVIGGVDHHLKSPFRNMGEMDNSTNALRYAKADDYPVMEASVLPEYLQSVCQDKSVYWLERTTEEVSSRDKRAVRVYYRCYLVYYYGRWYYRSYYIIVW